MAYVVLFAVSVFLAGVVMLVLLSVRAIRQVKAFGRTVAGASERVAEAAAGLEAVAELAADRAPSRRTLDHG